jgi:hypothetical protein
MLGLHLCFRLETMDCCSSFVLRLQEHKPHVLAEIVDEEKEVVLAAVRRGCDRATQVSVHQFQRLSGMELGHGREWCPPMFAGEACLTQLLDVAHRWEAAHQPLLGQLLQPLKALVDEVCIPPPGIVIGVS